MHDNSHTTHLWHLTNNLYFICIYKGKIGYLHCYWRSNALSSAMKIKARWKNYSKMFVRCWCSCNRYEVLTVLLKLMDAGVLRLLGFPLGYSLWFSTELFCILLPHLPLFFRHILLFLNISLDFMNHSEGTCWSFCICMPPSNLCVFSSNLFVHVASYPVSLSTKSHSNYTTKAD